MATTTTAPVPIRDSARAAAPPRAQTSARPLSLLGLVDLYRRSLALCVILFVGAGLVIAYFAPVTYTAQGQMLAAGTSVNAAAVPSFTQAGQSLAQTYSRVFSGDEVQGRLKAQGFDGTTETVAASPIANSSVILIEATAPTERDAVRLADDGIAALDKTVSGLLDNSSLIADTRANMLTAYKGQAEAKAKIDQLDKRKTDKNSTVYGDAIAALSEAQANATATQQLLQAQISDSVQANGVAPLASGQITGSNSRQRFQLWGASGLVAGVLVWLLVALVRSGRLRRSAPVRGQRRA